MNTALLEKGIKKALILLGLLVVSPIISQLGFRALKRFTTAPEIYIAYGLLILGGILVLFTIYFAIKTIQTFLNALFNS